MPNPANFKEADMDDEQDKILDTMPPEEAAKAWGEFDKTMETKYYPAVVTGYSGTAMIRGSKIGGMDNDNVRGMPTFAGCTSRDSDRLGDCRSSDSEPA